MPQADLKRSTLSGPLLLNAPHRAMFFVGAILLIAGVTWWLGVLAAVWRGWAFVAQPLPVGWMHGVVMQYAVLPPFIMGFLLTVFPRWLNTAPVPRRVYAAVFSLILGGTACLFISICGLPSALPFGLGAMLLGWMVAIAILGTHLHRQQWKDVWAKSAWLALVIGACGLAMILTASLGGPIGWVPAANHLATFGLLLPVYFTVAHRMVPFFSSNAIKGYTVVRPLASLVAVWVLSLGHLGFELLDAPAWRWIADVPMAALLFWQWLAWQPWKASRPGLLLVLYIALAWLPVSIGFYAIDSVHQMVSGVGSRALAPLHALTIGFFSAMLVAMVTRVTQGHSGRPLTMGVIPWLAFVGIQLATLVRVLAEYAALPLLWYISAASLWLLAMAPWVLRALWIYLTPRRDGAPG
ncbi:NnrS family protein [Dyella sp. C11]|uniref:NnrS family protein n=1 Tax=Dyella sp. C11 TaxID=2126991 RepID=UPI001300B19D|nr:NnrS family protein [Dyella sp. C11]